MAKIKIVENVFEIYYENCRLLQRNVCMIFYLESRPKCLSRCDECLMPWTIQLTASRFFGLVFNLSQLHCYPLLQSSQNIWTHYYIKQCINKNLLYSLWSQHWVGVRFVHEFHFFERICNFSVLHKLPTTSFQVTRQQSSVPGIAEEWFLVMPTTVV
jgi:hypothetical protein